MCECVGVTVCLLCQTVSVSCVASIHSGTHFSVCHPTEASHSSNRASGVHHSAEARGDLVQECGVRHTGHSESSEPSRSSSSTPRRFCRVGGAAGLGWAGLGWAGLEQLGDAAPLRV